MKLEKAIKILTEYIETAHEVGAINFDDAVQLGIEAMKAIEHYRLANSSWLSLYLPGE